VPIYNFSLQVQHVNPKKIYAVDQGIITAYSIKPFFEEASRLENAVFCALRRSCTQIFYYHTQTKHEVDFVTVSEKGDISLYQVCHDISQEDTRKRELRALQVAMQELEQKTSFLITDDTEETIQDSNSTIYCIPFWKWATTNIFE
jgi:predicted AAA+ superfamily ATPase